MSVAAGEALPPRPSGRAHALTVLLAGLLAIALGVLAGARGEGVNALWLLTAALCSYAIGYRLYSRFLAERVFPLEARRRTPAHRLENGRDFVPTRPFVLFGHHFAAIAGAGPLVGPILAAQFGFLPGLLWILIGVVLGGAVQDFVILAGSVRRDGRSLGQMARDELGPVVGFITGLAVLAIMVILLAVLALVVVKALAASPWGTFSLAMTIPIALLVGLYMQVLRPGRVLEGSLLGVGLLLLALVGGRHVAESPVWAPVFTLEARTLAWALMGYGFAASVLPVWLLLAPRDYLSTFVKVGTVGLMALGILITAPVLKLPALTSFIDGSGPVVAGALFPFCFITIACGAISGFHALVSSGTTPKLLDRETDCRVIGYGAMLMESFVAVMALVAACILEPGVYFAVNAPAALAGDNPVAVATTVSAWGFALAPGQMEALAAQVGEPSLYARTGGAPTFALGMAQVFASVVGGPAWMGFWYHFAIMFEALFILTTLDAGTRVGRFMLQDLLGHLWAPLGRTSWYPGAIAASALVVAGWGTFLYQGVVDPLGGINSLWPLFGIANQLLAAIALCVGTTFLVQMGRSRYVGVTLLPLAWLLAVCFSAGWEKIFSASPRVGFLAHRAQLEARLADGLVSAEQLGMTRTMIANDTLNAWVAGLFLLLTALVVLLSARRWGAVWRGQLPAVSSEVPAEYQPQAVGAAS
ncbi:MAG: carbon starvation CstA family protein [Candidatus Sericytochromatia bacterium]|nr:carbon starvation CstA family protein [Candidatus Sericytochromatia bacterium]